MKKEQAPNNGKKENGVEQPENIQGIKYSNK